MQGNRKETQAGAVIWLTGLSGAGKTTVGEKLAHRLRSSNPSVVFLDGDSFREIMGNDLGHSPEGRIQNAFRLSRMCRFLSLNRVTVVCATMSLYPEVWEWNRTHIPGYCEVYLRVKRETVENRDPKGLYARFREGREKNVIGFDLPLDEPSHAHLIVENDETSEAAVSRSCEMIFDFFNQKCLSEDNES